MTRIVLIFALSFGLSAIEASPSSSQAPAQHPGNAAPHAVAPNFPPSIVGHWSAPPERVPLSDDNAWGRNSASVRRTELTISANGTGTITVTRGVVKGAGAPLRGSRVIDRAEFVIGEEIRPAGLRPRYTTTIKSASRHYPDPPIVDTNIERLTIEIFPPEATAPDQLEVDFQVFRGDGSFDGRLLRQRTAAPARKD